jgi:hypothetical protein
MKGSNRGGAQSVEMRDEVQEREEEIRRARSSIPRSQAHLEQTVNKWIGEESQQFIVRHSARESRDEQRTDAGAESC